jgi:hypothetical protein
MLQDNFKGTTFSAILKLVLKDADSKHKINDETKHKEGEKNADIWNMFKKYPDREIVPLPKKSNPTVSKTAKLASQKEKEQHPFLAFQTLFREQSVAEGKAKTSSSVADSNYERLYSMKTEPKDKESFTEG